MIKLENYTPKGEIKDFPIEVIEWMLTEQVEQGNKQDVTVFERNSSELICKGGFDWKKSTRFSTNECYKIILGDFWIFFNKFPRTNKNMSTESKFTRGEIVEVSDDKCTWYKREFYDYCGDYFVVFSLKYEPVVYKYIRKVQKTVNVDGKVYPLEEAIALLESVR